MFILDTDVVSELRKANRAHQNVREWAQPVAVASLYISVISVLELEIGILLIDPTIITRTTLRLAFPRNSHS